MAKLVTEHEKSRLRTKDLGEFDLRLFNNVLILTQETMDGGVERYKVELTPAEIGEIVNWKGFRG